MKLEDVHRSWWEEGLESGNSVSLLGCREMPGSHLHLHLHRLRSCCCAAGPPHDPGQTHTPLSCACAARDAQLFNSNNRTSSNGATHEGENGNNGLAPPPAAIGASGEPAHPLLSASSEESQSGGVDPQLEKLGKLDPVAQVRPSAARFGCHMLKPRQTPCHASTTAAC